VSNRILEKSSNQSVSVCLNFIEKTATSRNRTASTHRSRFHNAVEINFAYINAQVIRKLILRFYWSSTRWPMLLPFRFEKYIRDCQKKCSDQQSQNSSFFSENRYSNVSRTEQSILSDNKWKDDYFYFVQYYPVFFSKYN